MHSSDLRTVIVGTGAVAAAHVDALASPRVAARLVGVVSRDPDRARDAAARWRVPAHVDLDAALATEHPELVVVCAESGRHADVTVQALRHGAHVFVEKPLEVSLERVDRIDVAARAAGRLVAVVSQHRFDPATRAVADAIGRGDLGRLTSAVARLALWRSQEYYDSPGWRGTWRLDGGGALMNQGIHTVDLLLALMGPADEVSGRVGRLAHTGLEAEDLAVGTVRFSSGALGVIHASTASGGRVGTRLEIHGTSGSAIIDDDRLVWLGGAATEGPAPSDSLVEQYRNVLAAIAGEERLTVGIPGNRAAIALITALYDDAGR